MRVFNIRSGSEKSLAAVSALKEELSGFGVPDEVMKLIDDQLTFCERVKFDADSISRLFDADRICEYVKIREKLDETCRRIKKYAPVLKRTVTVDYDIKCSVAKVSYTVFESALFETVRALCKYLPEGGNGIIKIREAGKTGIRISASCDAREDFDMSLIAGEITDIKCAFEYMGGKAEVSDGENGLSIRASAPVSLSNYNRRVKTYDLNDICEDDICDVLSEKTGLSPEELEKADELILFRSPSSEPEYPVTDILAEVMLSPIAAL